MRIHITIFLLPLVDIFSTSGSTVQRTVPIMRHRAKRRTNSIYILLRWAIGSENSTAARQDVHGESSDIAVATGKEATRKLPHEVVFDGGGAGPLICGPYDLIPDDEYYLTVEWSEGKLYNSEFCEVSYNEQLNVAFVKWKKFCCKDDYRKSALYAIDIMKAHDGCNFVCDTRNG